MRDDVLGHHATVHMPVFSFGGDGGTVQFTSPPPSSPMPPPPPPPPIEAASRCPAPRIPPGEEEKLNMSNNTVDDKTLLGDYEEKPDIWASAVC